ncbi:hypothetical protein [Lactococcus lactis]|uniref:hypothetical protein n=1 Tax=Lactococcus lactis TaxID=1358 RepID=UPI00205B4406|nr:hypothetical protein [Lactococcus lactis]BDH82524.1 hypothetical protein LLL8_21810 [Lactococcus lactis]
MSYDKQTWNKYDELKTEEENIENGAVVTDNRMNHMETGIGDNDANLASHLADKNNPHKVTAAQVGLDKVDNVKQASKVEFDSHVNNKSNPHAVTASQVGAYSKSETDTKFATNQSLTDLSTKVIANKGNLASGTDLDNVIDIGTYRIGGLTGGTDIINVPSGRSGTTIYAYLTVSGTTTSVVQELIVYDSKTVSQIYSRSRSGSTPTFSPWSKTVMADDSGKVKLTDFEVTTISETVNIGNGLSLNFQRKGEFVLVRFSGSLTAINSGTYFPTAVPAQWRPDGIKELIGHFASGALAFHVDLETDGRVKWWGASGATGAPRGTAMYFLK